MIRVLVRGAARDMLHVGESLVVRGMNNNNL